jgi:two-component system sensor histidine kinase QseC
MSLQRQLLSLIIAVITLASFTVALYGYRTNLAALESTFDQELVTAVQFLSSINVGTESKVSIKKQLDSKSDYPLIYQIQNTKNTHMSEPWYGGKVNGFSEQRFLQKRWRVYTVIDPNRRIMAAQPIQQRLDTAESILLAGIQPVLISLLLVALMVIYVVRTSLKPISQLSRQIQSRSSQDLTPLRVADIPDEIQPVLSRLNSLLLELDSAFEREKQLAANAAHELRTPISVLSINSHNLMADFKSSELSESSFNELQDNVERMAHVVEQIIALYRYSQHTFSLQKGAIDIALLFQDLVSDQYELLEKRNQSIEIDCQVSQIYGERFSLTVLMENLVRNAHKYGGEGCHIKISSFSDENLIWLSVEDSGPGVEADKLQQIWRRFYRAAEYETNQKAAKGSGLGLSIVKHIADLYSAKVDASRSELGGLLIKVGFPKQHGEQQ